MYETHHLMVIHSYPKYDKPNDVPKKTKRLIGHIAHLRKLIKSINMMIITMLIKRRKNF